MSKIISGIYKITMISDNRIYVGSSIDIHKRWKYHCTKLTQLIGKMIRLHGKDAFYFEIIEETLPIKEVLLDREQFYLDSLQPFPWNNNKGFNLSPKAYSPLGIKRSETTKQKMRDSWHKNRGEEYYKILSEKSRGDKNPSKRPEVREKISNSKKGQTWKNDTERVEKHRLARKGKKFSEKARENFRIAQQKNKTRSTEAKEKFYLAQRKLYEVIKPNGETFQIYSRELKDYCKNNNLSYSNLISATNPFKPYKKGWYVRRLD